MYACYILITLITLTKSLINVKHSRMQLKHYFMIFVQVHVVERRLGRKTISTLNVLKE